MRERKQNAVTDVRKANEQAPLLLPRRRAAKTAQTQAVTLTRK
jgi:hypothetical protein